MLINKPTWMHHKCPIPPHLHLKCSHLFHEDAISFSSEQNRAVSQNTLKAVMLTRGAPVSRLVRLPPLSSITHLFPALETEQDVLPPGMDENSLITPWHSSMNQAVVADWNSNASLNRMLVSNVNTDFNSGFSFLTKRTENGVLTML